jgi:hypothetical protein
MKIDELKKCLVSDTEVLAPSPIGDKKLSAKILTVHENGAWLLFPDLNRKVFFYNTEKGKNSISDISKIRGKKELIDPIEENLKGGE